MWGIPVVRSIRVQPNSALPRDMIAVQTRDLSPQQDEGPLRLRLAEYPFGVIHESALADRARELFERFERDWQPIPELTFGGPYWHVPRWSLPVWQVTGTKASPGESVIALRALNALIRVLYQLGVPPEEIQPRERLLDDMRKEDPSAPAQHSDTFC